MEKNQNIERKIEQGMFIDECGILKYKIDKTHEEQPHYILQYDEINEPIKGDSIKFSEKDNEHLIRSFIEHYGHNRMTISNIPFDSSITDYLAQTEFSPLIRPGYLVDQVIYTNF